MEKLKNLTINKLSFKSSFTWSIRLLICLFLFSSCERDEVKPSKETKTITEGIEQENSMETMSFLEFSETDAYREVQERYHKPSSGNYEGRNGPCDGLLYAVTGPIHSISAPVFIDGYRVNGITYVMPISQIDDTSGRPTGNESAHFYNLIIVKTKDITSTYIMKYEQRNNALKRIYYLPPNSSGRMVSVPCGSVTVDYPCCYGKYASQHTKTCCCIKDDCRNEKSGPGPSSATFIIPCDDNAADDCFGGIGGYTSGSNTSTGAGTGQGSSGNDSNPPRVFLKPGEDTKNYPDGTATPPAHVDSYTTNESVRESMVFELPGRSLISLLEIEQGTEAYQWLTTFMNSKAHKKIFDFVNEHTENGVVEPEALEFANDMIAFIVENGGTFDFDDSINEDEALPNVDSFEDLDNYIENLNNSLPISSINYSSSEQPNTRTNENTFTISETFDTKLRVNTQIDLEQYPVQVTGVESSLFGNTTIFGWEQDNNYDVIDQSNTYEKITIKLTGQLKTGIILGEFGGMYVTHIFHIRIVIDSVTGEVTGAWITLIE